MTGFTLELTEDQTTLQKWVHEFSENSWTHFCRVCWSSVSSRVKPVMVRRSCG